MIVITVFKYLSDGAWILRFQIEGRRIRNNIRQRISNVELVVLEDDALNEA